MFVYNSTHKIAICTLCKSAIVPGPKSLEWHLRSKPHRLVGDIFTTNLQLLQSYSLRSIEELRVEKPTPTDDCNLIEHLESFTGFCCTHQGCSYNTTVEKKIREHVWIIHQVKAKDHDSGVSLWRKCTLQTYFTARRLIDYFVVVEQEVGLASKANENLTQLTEGEKAYFKEVEADYRQVKEEIAIQAGIVHDFEDSRSSKVPWLERTAFPSHIAGLTDNEIHASYCLPPAKELKGLSESTNPTLVRIVNATRSLLQDAYRLCNDNSPDCKMTYQRATILNQFYAGASGKSDAFRASKLESTLVDYFRTWTQLVVYYYRVVYLEDGHFEKHLAGSEPESRRLPKEVIQPTSQQERMMQEIIKLAEVPNDDDDDEATLKHALQNFFLALICHTVGSVPFRSPILSFCAMLARSKRIALRTQVEKGQPHTIGRWKDPGVYTSHLSALTWTAQLIIFNYACFMKQDDENRIPVLLGEICGKFFQQLAETPFGHILQWRLYLFEVSKNQLARFQARWSLDKKTVGYKGVELQMSHIPQLILSEYRKAYTFLHQDLLFEGLDKLTTVNPADSDPNPYVQLQAWKLKDDLDMADYGESWVTDPKNAELVQQAEGALLQCIQYSTQLRAMFLIKSAEGVVRFNNKAIDVYEAKVQDFLKRLLILCHITSGQPLREPEMLSILWRNTSRHRHIMIWEKLVMIFTQYHKGQQQSGVYKDNIRFLPKPIGDMLLQYIGLVLPLRQIFLRQRKPKEVISPYLWSTLEGQVWPDGTVFKCLTRACIRAKIARLHTLNWRHLSAAICKEKFSGKDYAMFSSENVITEDLEGEQDLVALAQQSNHSYATFNMAYAGSTVLTMDTLLHRSHRASLLWHDLFRFENILQIKRGRSESDVLSFRLLDDAKRGQQRKRGVYSEADLLTIARKVYQTPDLQLRVPGQQAAVLAVLGPQRAEQVIVILATGSGKTLIIILGVMLADARTTILILPLVALRNDMLRRFDEAGIKPLIWTPVIMRSASLVIVSVEAACSEQFVGYAQRLVMQQQLDRIIIDECHLTVTASDYRSHMAELGWHLGQIKTQTVWLTATLLPSMQDEFILQNKLVQPRIVRESTNRANIKYLVMRQAGSVLNQAAGLVQSWASTEGFDQRRDKIIVYCHSREDARMLGEILNCSVYTSESGTVEQKAVLIQQWLGDINQAAIVATSALGPGFDYPYIQLVIHAGAPKRLSSFAQESGRAGRAGQAARSIILLNASWVVEEDGEYASTDHEAMELYLSSQFCYRGILSQTLDLPVDWLWCMEGDEACGFCIQANTEARPAEVRFKFKGVQAEAVIPTDSLTEVRRQDYLEEQALERYEHNLQLMGGLCLYCRAMARPFEHRAGACPRRWDWIKAKKDVLDECKRQGKEWMAAYVVCWKCFQPQEICRVADVEEEESECQYPDMVIPLCYGVYQGVGGPRWIFERFGRRFHNERAYMIWLGEKGRFSGLVCTQAHCVAAEALAMFG
jgi:Orsellinic acid/F9775 biosynthesis cluster protein D/Helicase conserved C-terminal domain/DEAD/DEAH box helicase